MSSLPVKNWLNFSFRGQFEINILIVRHIQNNIFHMNLKKISSRHLTSVVTKDMSGATEALSYAHLFDQCTQDWFSVASILEDLLTKLKARNPLIQRAYLKSDEAGCYHNSSLIAAVRDIAERWCYST